jgi:hypothetical protein
MREIEHRIFILKDDASSLLPQHRKTIFSVSETGRKDLVGAAGPCQFWQCESPDGQINNLIYARMTKLVGQSVCHFSDIRKL